MKKILLTTLLSAATIPVCAESLHYNVLEFSESASVRVQRDTMNLILRITETGKSRQEVSNTVSRRINAVMARAKANKTFEIESRNRQTYPEYDDKRNITGWTDYAQISISSQDFDALSKLAADSQELAMIDNISFSISPAKRTAAVEQASQNALQSFRKRAQNTSNALGFSHYKIVNIKLQQSFDMQSEQLVAAPSTARRAAKLQAADIMEINAGAEEIQQTIQATVQMY